MPLRSEDNMSKEKAFLYGAASGFVEPVAAGITILLSEVMTPILPYLLAFAAGAMLYVVVEELIPEASEGEHSNIGTIGFAAGFVFDDGAGCGAGIEKEAFSFLFLFW